VTPTTLRNPLRGEVRPSLPSGDPLEVHRRLPGYAPTPLQQAPSLAEALGLGEVWVKDESSRMGLPAFKILGASWAVYRALSERLGEDPEPWETVEDLAERFASLRPLTLATATDGNHGRAVARMARLLGLQARIYVPAGTAPARMAAIASEGAEVEVVLGSYDDAVRRAAEQASREVAVVPDTALYGFEPEPRWVIEGYTTIFREVDEQARGPFDVVTVQMGVGALAASVVSHYRPGGARIVGVEPDQAACVLASVVAGEIVSLPGHQDSIMAGLNCGTPSPMAWPAVSAGLDLLVAVEDERAREAMRALASEGITSGETGAAGLAGLLEALTGPGSSGTREYLKLDDRSRALVLSTEGATDPDAYRKIVG
jgi:diaminopropionate ammonia-lyase